MTTTTPTLGITYTLADPPVHDGNRSTYLHSATVDTIDGDPAHGTYGPMVMWVTVTVWQHTVGDHPEVTAEVDTDPFGYLLTDDDEVLAYWWPDGSSRIVPDDLWQRVESDARRVALDARGAALDAYRAALDTSMGRS